MESTRKQIANEPRTMGNDMERDWTGQRDRETDTNRQTDRQTDRHKRAHHLMLTAALAAPSARPNLGMRRLGELTQIINHKKNKKNNNKRNSSNKHQREHRNTVGLSMCECLSVVRAPVYSSVCLSTVMSVCLCQCYMNVNASVLCEYCVRCTVYCVLCVYCCVQYAHCALCTVCTEYCVLCVLVYSLLCTVDCHTLLFIAGRTPDMRTEGGTESADCHSGFIGLFSCLRKRLPKSALSSKRTSGSLGNKLFERRRRRGRRQKKKKKKKRETERSDRDRGEQRGREKREER
jgi:hypothetical protein